MAAWRNARSHTVSTSAEVRPVIRVVVDALPDQVVVGWMSATVGMLRTYQYGGPIPHVPLRRAFPGLANTDRGAWCIVRDAPNTSSLWGIVPDRHPRRVLTVTGPGSGRYRGRIDRPPQPP
jgi:hypothetical protein